ncbi:axin interactor, dorsalization-associated protein isoform X3 [Ambystoma mexicanum]|uniref:axin interactor, dorsalization-associated protein isoform X3 n=1 Tax=Ambystoma mexicanum TaxID=8296 RepID=UPI0037E8AFBF
MAEVQKMLQRWHASFSKATDFDSWGQLVEAVDEYHILARHLQKEAQSQTNANEFTEDQKKTIGKIATCLELRSAALQSSQSQEDFKLEDLKKLEPSLDFKIKCMNMTENSRSQFQMRCWYKRTQVIKNIFAYNKEFPFDVQPVPLRKILAPGEEENLEFEEEEEDGGAGAGSPDAFPVRVPDLNGIDLTPVQDTPVASRKEDTYVHFNVDIDIQKHVEKLTKGAAIFFEFKHYKPKKRFTSTKCFAFMEMDEIKPGPIVIELYKKPTDFKRKKLQLMTKKPLYLHLHQTLLKD